MIYLDNAATTACSVEVIDAMMPYFREKFANASSIDHGPGNEAKSAVEESRAAIASLVGARPEDVIFTSGATEANNLVMSVAQRVLTTRVEHPSLLDAFANRNCATDAYLTTDNLGIVDQAALGNDLHEDAMTLVSTIATNNETGVNQDISALASIAAANNALFHADATQAVGTMRINMGRLAGLSGVSLSAHKIHGPKGVGALIASKALRRQLLAVQRGGGHERGLRSGTLNVPGIVGFGVAAKIVANTFDERLTRLQTLRSLFEANLANLLGDQFVRTVNEECTSPHIISGRFKGINGRALLRAMRDDVAFSLGAACATNKSEPSHVLTALGLDKREIAETVRFSFSHDESPETVRHAASLLADGVRDLSNFSLTA